MPEPIAAQKELGRILRPNGGLFLSAPLGSGLHQQSYHFYGGTPHFYDRVLDEIGFKIVSVEPNERVCSHGTAGIISWCLYHPAASWLFSMASGGLVSQGSVKLVDGVMAHLTE